MKRLTWRLIGYKNFKFMFSLEISCFFCRDLNSFVVWDYNQIYENILCVIIIRFHTIFDFFYRYFVTSNNKNRVRKRGLTQATKQTYFAKAILLKKNLPKSKVNKQELSWAKKSDPGRAFCSSWKKKEERDPLVGLT